MEKGIEQSSSSPATAQTQFITLQKAIELGEYEPSVLSKFDDWKLLSAHGQWQLIKQGLDNHERQLRVQWADVCNVLDFSKKTHLQAALRAIESKIKKVWDDRERLYLEFAQK